jgi:hypothetical protein
MVLSSQFIPSSSLGFLSSCNIYFLVRVEINSAPGCISCVDLWSVVCVNSKDCHVLLFLVLSGYNMHTTCLRKCLIENNTEEETLL